MSSGFFPFGIGGYFGFNRARYKFIQVNVFALNSFASDIANAPQAPANGANNAHYQRLPTSNAVMEL
jgi:hypothetical protein